MLAYLKLVMATHNFERSLVEKSRRVVHACKALQLELEHIAWSAALADPRGNHLADATRALQRVAVHSGAHEVVSDLGRLSQYPAAVGREGVGRVQKEVVLGLLENRETFCGRRDIIGHVSPVGLGYVIPRYVLAVVDAL